MQLAHKSISVLLITSLAGCSTIEVSIDYDSSEDFSRFTSFDLITELPEPTGDWRIDNPLLESRVRAAVENQMAAKGYKRATDGSADFLVGYHAAIERCLSVEVMNSRYDYGPGSGSADYRYGHGWGYSRAWGPGPASRTYTRYYDEGSLILDIVTPHKKRLIWRGAAKAEIHEADSPRTKRERINEAVERMLGRFPPE